MGLRRRLGDGSLPAVRVHAGIIAVVLFGCANRPGGEAGEPQETTATATVTPSGSDETRGGSTATATEDTSTAGPGTTGTDAAVADVVEVVVSGPSGAHTFAVTLRSPDTGCDRYADWWEVLDADGALLYRRILGHSHVDEQPFTRTGGPVPVAAGAEVWVRAHMHGDASAPDGYGGQTLRGTVDGGFGPADAQALPSAHEQPPLPQSCAF